MGSMIYYVVLLSMLILISVILMYVSNRKWKTENVVNSPWSVYST